MESGTYHYHQGASCIEGYLDAWDTKSEFFIGVALDGFPIYSMYDSDGELVTNSQLDDCHGYDPGTGYRYIANTEFPYMVGCFKGTPIDSVNEHCGRRRRLFSETKPNIRLRERQLTELCSVVNNSHCADSSCGFVCDEDCSLWTTGDDAENAADDDDGDASCFSGDDLVTLETGDAIRLSEVRIGDRILSASKDGVSSFSDVVFLPHGRVSNSRYSCFPYDPLTHLNALLELLFPSWAEFSHVVFVLTKQMHAVLLEWPLSLSSDGRHGAWSEV